ncbi:MAG: hypothetical protein V4539_17185 [Bacteroidota bacterium]
METFFKDLSSALLAFLDKYHGSVVVRILEEQRYTEEPERFYYTIAHKANSTLYSINHVLCNFHSHYHMRISAYLLFRSIMLDVITGEYIIRQNNDDAQRKEMILRLNADHIYHTYRAIGTTAKQVFGFCDEEVEQMKASLRARRSMYFEGDEMSVKPLNTSVFAMARKLTDGSVEGAALHFVQRAFNYYDLYSKYEHPGDLSFHLTHRVYETENAVKDYSELYECLQITLAFLVSIVHLWDYETKELEKLSDNVLLFTPDELEKRVKDD